MKQPKNFVDALSKKYQSPTDNLESAHDKDKGMKTQKCDTTNQVDRLQQIR